MEVEIVLKNVNRPVHVEVDLEKDIIAQNINNALINGEPLQFETSDSRTVVVNPRAIGFVTIGSEKHRSIGFGVA